jgi:hypothetical protein
MKHLVRRYGVAPDHKTNLQKKWFGPKTLHQALLRPHQWSPQMKSARIRCFMGLAAPST